MICQNYRMLSFANPCDSSSHCKCYVYHAIEKKINSKLITCNITWMHQYSANSTLLSVVTIFGLTYLSKPLDYFPFVYIPDKDTIFCCCSTNAIHISYKTVFKLNAAFENLHRKLAITIFLLLFLHNFISKQYAITTNDNNNNSTKSKK